MTTLHQSRSTLRRLTCLLITIPFVLVSCSGQTPVPATDTSPPPTPAPPTSTIQSGPFFEPVSLDSIIQRKEGTFYANAIDPGAVLVHEGIFYMFFNGLVGWPSKAAVGLATSPNGVDWTVLSDTPLLASADETFDGFTFFASSVVVLDDGTWAMYLYTLTEGRDGAPGQILLATSPAPEGPWTLHPDPVLTPGEEGAWDDTRVTHPSVLRNDEGFVMYFTGADGDRLRSVRRIGLATSPDGMTWQKMETPILELGESGDWDMHRTFQPHVVRRPDGYLMLYKANVQIGRAEGFGIAESPNGIRWTKSTENPMITTETYPIEWRRTGYAEMVYEDGKLYLFIEILEREGGTYPQGNSRYFSNIHGATREP